MVFDDGALSLVRDLAGVYAAVSVVAVLLRVWLETRRRGGRL